MNNAGSYGILIFAVLVLLFFNGLMSRDICNWIPSVPKKVSLLTLVWTLPFLGLYLANMHGKLGWFKKSNSNADTVISGGFMEVDAVVNPGARHRIEMVEKQKTEIHHEHKQAGDESKPNT